METLLNPNMYYQPSGYTPTFNYQQGGMVPNMMQQTQQTMPMTQAFGGFKPDAMKRIANNLGYQGDMSGFNNFLNSNPDKKQKMDMYNQKAMQMAQGGTVQKFQEGGTPATGANPAPLGQQYIPPQTLPTSGKLEDVFALQAVTPGLPVGSTVVPVGTTMEAGQFIDPRSGQVSGAAAVPTALASTSQAGIQQSTAPTLMGATTAAGAVEQVVDQTKAAQGTVSQQAQVSAAQGTVSDAAMADAAQFDPNYISNINAGNLNVTSSQLVEAQGQDEVAPAVKIAQTSGIEPAVAQQATVSVNELPQPAQIAESNMAQAQVAQSGGFLREDAVAYAAKLNSFSVDNGTLAKAIQGEVGALGTVQGQLENLMSQFDDGTPTWAAGAMRAANAAMAARGLGGSSMAGAAILQAAMESALPIAQQDAQTFNQMNMSNLNRRQQVSLTNAAAQQGLSLQNLNNEQQAALQNSTNAFTLQAQDLSNMQQTFLANAQIKAAFQGQNLSNQQQTNLVTAARYAEVANMNLNNRQQTALVNNANNLRTDLANLSNRQQAYVSNANLAAALQGKQIDTRQQAAIQNAARFAEAANIQFTAEQQEQIHNSELAKTIGLANLSNEQATTLQNAATLANMDMANLNNRQQAAVQNAQNFLQMDLTNLSNKQQTELFRVQQRVQSLFSDQAAVNAAAQFNATSQNQTDQFFASLASQTAQFNVSQANAQSQFNAGQVNVVERFNTEVNNQREQFNATNRLVIDQANAQWRREIATANTEAVNRANEINAEALLGVSRDAYNNLWQYYSDNMEWAWTASENEKTRMVNLATAQLNSDTALDLQDIKNDYSSSVGFGSLIGSILTSDLTNTLGGTILGGVFEGISDLF
jgi:hypothetical protein